MFPVLAPVILYVGRHISGRVGDEGPASTRPADDLDDLLIKESTMSEIGPLSRRSALAGLGVGTLGLFASHVASVSAGDAISSTSRCIDDRCLPPPHRPLALAYRPVGGR